MTRMIYHPDTGTFMALTDCVVMDVPSDMTNAEDIEGFLQSSDASLNLGQALILPMTAEDNAVLEHAADTPDIEWKSQAGSNLWVGVQDLAIKIRHEAGAVSVSLFRDPDDGAIEEVRVGI